MKIVSSIIFLIFIGILANPKSTNTLSIEQIAFNFAVDSVLVQEKVLSKSKIYFTGKTVGKKSFHVLAGHCLNYYHILDDDKGVEYLKMKALDDSLLYTTYEKLFIKSKKPIKKLELLGFRRSIGERDRLLNVYNAIKLDETFFVEIELADRSNCGFIYYLILISPESRRIKKYCRWSIEY